MNKSLATTGSLNGNDVNLFVEEIAHEYRYKFTMETNLSDSLIPKKWKFEILFGSYNKDDGNLMNSPLTREEMGKVIIENWEYLNDKTISSDTIHKDRKISNLFKLKKYKI